jgi:Immunity protein 50
MENLEKSIHGSEKLTSIFGRWPSFHDAEIHEVFLNRDDADQGQERVPPCALLKIHLWEMTSEVDAQGYYVLRNHTLVTLMFSDIEELDLRHFNHQNVLSGLAIKKANSGPGNSKTFRVWLESSFGLAGTFTCKRIEVLEAVPCTSSGGAIQQAS